MHGCLVEEAIKPEDRAPQGDEFLMVGVPVPAGRGPGDGQVGEDLDIGGEARELHVPRDVAPGSLAQPVGLRPDELVVPPDDRVGGVLGVDDAREAPRAEFAPVQVCAQVGGFVDEAHAAPIVDDGRDLGTARVPRGGERLVHGGEGGGAYPQCAVHLGERVFNGGEHGLRREGTEGLAADKQRGA